MKKTAKRWLAGLLLLLAANFALLNFLAYNQARTMTWFSTGGPRTHKPEKLGRLTRLKVMLSGINLPRPAGSQSPAELHPDCKVLSIAGTNKVTLSAWYSSMGDKAPLVILFHGYGSEKTSLLDEAKIFRELGTSVLLVDFRGCGGSSESYTTIGVREADDVEAVVHYARDNLKYSSMILFGRSMGSAAILRAIDRNGVKPDAVILEAVFDTLLNTVRNRFKAMRVPSFPCAELMVFWGGIQWNFNGFAHKPVEYVKSLRCPALFMHGSDDTRVTLAEGRAVFKAAPGRKVFKEFDRSAHEAYSSSHPDEWRTTVREFLKSIGNSGNKTADADISHLPKTLALKCLSSNILSRYCAGLQRNPDSCCYYFNSCFILFAACR